MNVAEFKINFECIEAQIYGCIEKSFEAIDSNSEIDGTSYGVMLDTRFGRLSISLNGDDDASYCCDAVGAFTGPYLSGVKLVELDEFREKYESSELEEELRIRAMIDGEERSFESGEFERFLYERVLRCVKDAFKNRKRDRWLPYWIRFEDDNMGEVEHWRCRDDSLPRERAWVADPIEGQRIESARRKICIYKLANKCRKYVGLDFEKRVILDGTSLWGTDAIPVEVRSHAGMLRFGDIAPMGFCKDFAVNLERPMAGDIKELVKADVEFIPFEVSGRRWEFCNCLSVCDVIDLKTTRFANRSIGNIRQIEEIEFCEEALRSLSSKVFRVSEWPQGGVYFISSPENKGVLEFCEENGLRGAGFDLVWTSDSESLKGLAEEFVGLVKRRLMRLHGNDEVKDSIDVECLYGYQKDMWRLLEADRIFQEEGSRGLIEKVQGLADLKNPAVRKLVPDSWYWFNQGDEGEVAERLEEEFLGKSLLDGMNGYLCRMLPKGIRDIEHMEGTKSGHMAVFGPEI